jgi:hypothetical protein
MTREDIAMHAVALHTGEVAGSIPAAPTSLRCFAATAGKPARAPSGETAKVYFLEN